MGDRPADCHGCAQGQRLTVTCTRFDPAGPPAGPTTEQAAAMLNLIAAREGMETDASPMGHEGIVVNATDMLALVEHLIAKADRRRPERTIHIDLAPGWGACS